MNVLVYAHREEMPRQPEYERWLTSVVEADAPYAVSDSVLSGFVRVVTHPRVFSIPTPLSQALDVVEELRRQANCVPVVPGGRHWSIFTRLCRDVDARGNLVPDAYHAALAIETGSDWITTDRDYSRFPGLRWRHPLDG